MAISTPAADDRFFFSVFSLLLETAAVFRVANLNAALMLSVT